MYFNDDTLKAPTEKHKKKYKIKLVFLIFQSYIWYREIPFYQRKENDRQKNGESKSISRILIGLSLSFKKLTLKMEFPNNFGANDILLYHLCIPNIQVFHAFDCAFTGLSPYFHTLNRQFTLLAYICHQ